MKAALKAAPGRVVIEAQLLPRRNVAERDEHHRGPRWHRAVFDPLSTPPQQLLHHVPSHDIRLRGAGVVGKAPQLPSTVDHRVVRPRARPRFTTFRASIRYSLDETLALNVDMSSL